MKTVTKPPRTKKASAAKTANKQAAANDPAPKSRQRRQQEIPGAIVRDGEVDDLAATYIEAKLARVAATNHETKTRDELRDCMKEKGLEQYAYEDGEEVWDITTKVIEETEKLQAKKRKGKSDSEGGE